MLNKESKLFCLQQIKAETKNVDSLEIKIQLIEKDNISHKSFWHHIGQITSKSTYFPSFTSDLGKCRHSNG